MRCGLGRFGRHSWGATTEEMGDRIPTLRRQDGKSNREEMYGLVKSNSTSQEAIEKANDEIRFLTQEKRSYGRT